MPLECAIVNAFVHMKRHQAASLLNCQPDTTLKKLIIYFAISNITSLLLVTNSVIRSGVSVPWLNWARS